VELVLLLKGGADRKNAKQIIVYAAARTSEAQKMVAGSFWSMEVGSWKSEPMQGIKSARCMMHLQETPMRSSFF
jgi:hypothetical protein